MKQPHPRLTQVLVLTAMLVASFCLSAPVTDDQKKIFIDEQLRLADGMKDRGYYQLALDEYKQIISRFQNDELTADAWVGLAESYCLIGNYKEGISAYETFFGKFPGVSTIDSVRIAYANALVKADPSKGLESIRIISNIAKDGKTEIARDFAKYSLGKFYTEQQNLPEAENEFRKLAAEEIKSQDDVYKIHGRIELALLVRKKHFDEAIGILDKLSSLKFLSIAQKKSIIKITAEIFSENGNYPAAADKYQELYLNCHGTPEGEDAILGMTDNLVRYGSYLKVIHESEGYVNAFKSDSGKMKFLYLLALAHDKENNGAKAEEYLKTAILSKATDRELMEKCVTLLIEILIRAKKYEEAFQEAEKFMERDSMSSKSRITVVRDILAVPEADYRDKKAYLLKNSAKFAKDSYEKDYFKYEMAMLLVQSSSFQEALDLLKTIEDPGIKPAATVEKAKCLEKLGLDDQALSAYDEAISNGRNSPTAGNAVVLSATLRLKNNQTDSAQKLLTSFIRDNPDSKMLPEAFFYLGFTLMKKEDYGNALKCFNKTLAHPVRSQEVTIQAEIHLCWAFLLDNKWAEAEKSALLFINDDTKLESSDPAFLLLLGKKYLENKNPASAMKCFTAISLMPSVDNSLRDEAFFWTALAQSKTGRQEDAVKTFEKLEKAGTQDADLYSRICANLAEIYLETGKNSEAAVYFEKCLETPKNRNAATKARLGLAKLLSESPDHLERAASYAVQVFITSEDPQTVSEAMRLHIKLSIKLNRKDDALKTLAEFRKKFPEPPEDGEFKEIIRLIEN